MKKEKSKLTMRSSVRTLSIKCYDEQLPSGFEYIINKIKNVDANDFQILAIKHDKDTNNDNIWQPSAIKPHYHIIVRVLGINSAHVSTKLDDKLWEQHGVETIKSFPSMAMYLTHDTEQAELDGKYKYDIEDIISNLSPNEIRSVREGYIRLNDTKVSINDFETLDKIAYKKGLNLEMFDEWYDSLPFKVRCNCKIKTVKESYERGVLRAISTDIPITRLCIFITGEANMGKTYGCCTALKGKNTLVVGGGGTGKYDKITVSTDAIIIDDDVAPNLLNMTDNKVVQAYKRMSNNPIWRGQYFIVTSNKGIDDWLRDCGLSSVNIEAAKSRFYICEVERDGSIVVLGHSSRGNVSMQKERYSMFLSFLLTCEKSIKDYVAIKKESVNYDSLYNRWIYVDDEENPFA